MKKRYTEEQIIKFLKEGDSGVGVKELCRRHGFSEASYYVWIDHFNVLGLGENVPIAMGNGSDSIMPFVDGKFVTLRLPYPSGLFPKNVDGRIDDPAAGWKGRGLWTTSGTRVNFHLEAGKENRPKAIKTAQAGSAGALNE